MAKNTGKNNGERRGNANLRPWKPGQSGNPNGRPSGVRTWAVVLRERFEQGEITQEQLMDKLVAIADKGDLRAMDIIMERMDGKADQKLKLEGRSIIELISDGSKAAEQAKAEAEDK